MGLKRISVITCDGCGKEMKGSKKYFVLEKVVSGHKTLGDFTMKEYLCATCLLKLARTHSRDE